MPRRSACCAAAALCACSALIPPVATSHRRQLVRSAGDAPEPPAAPPRFAPKSEPDDISRGVDGVKDVAARTTGLLGLGLTFWLDLPFARLFAVFSLALTAFLYRDLGDAFVAKAPPPEAPAAARSRPSATVLRGLNSEGS